MPTPFGLMHEAHGCSGPLNKKQKNTKTQKQKKNQFAPDREAQLFVGGSCRV